MHAASALLHLLNNRREKGIFGAFVKFSDELNPEFSNSGRPKRGRRFGQRRRGAFGSSPIALEKQDFVRGNEVFQTKNPQV